MNSNELKVGEYYAYRERREAEVVKVKLVENIDRPRKVKVRFESGPYPGLVDYVETRQLLSRWSEREPVLRDEALTQRLKEYVAAHRNPAGEIAVETVLEATGEPGASVDNGRVHLSAEAFERIVMRAGLRDRKPTDLSPRAFIDRKSYVHLAWDDAEELVRAFAASEPDTVTMFIDQEEAELRARGFQRGRGTYHDVLRMYQPGWALARQWAGGRREVASLRLQLEALTSLLTQAAKELEERGAEDLAVRCRKAIESF
jgi:hypothetical protein